MSKFDREAFMDDPTEEYLGKLTREALYDVSKSLGLEEARITDSKQTLVDRLFKKLTADMASGGSDEVKDEYIDSSANVQLAIRRLELEHELQIAKLRIDVDREIRLKELELAKHVPSPTPTHDFNVAQQVRLVPIFREADVDKYFEVFERVAVNIKWPKSYWPLLLQTVLTGQAQRVYASLSIDQSNDYDVLKRSILNAYAQSPEAYRQKFRHLSKQPDISYKELAREQETWFNRWTETAGLATQNETLRELMLLEQFKTCVGRDLRIYLEEQHVKTASEAATIADEYILLRQESSSCRKSVNDSKPCSDKAGNTLQEKRTFDSPSNRAPDQRMQTGNCFYCQKPGHRIAQCRLRIADLKKHTPENSEHDRPGKPLANAHAVVKPLECNERISMSNPDQNDYDKLRNLVTGSTNLAKVPAIFSPYLSEAEISLVNDNNKVCVSVLRDTGASQTLVRQCILPFSEMSETGVSVVMCGVEMGCMSVPLHKVMLKTKHYNGEAVVGVRSSLPVEGVDILLGNDLGSELCPESINAQNDDEVEFISPTVPNILVSKIPVETTETHPSCVTFTK